MAKDRLSCKIFTCARQPLTRLGPGEDLKQELDKKPTPKIIERFLTFFCQPKKFLYFCHYFVVILLTSRFDPDLDINILVRQFSCL